MKDKITINAQSSIRIETTKIIYFDPFAISNARNDADLIFITHDHFDHLDLESIKKIIKEDTKIIIPQSIVDKVLAIGLKKDNLIEVVPNQDYNILGFKVKTLPSYNTTKQFHLREYNYVGYVITIENEDIYISGDIDIIPEAQTLKCDIALIPIGGTYTMNYQEAATLINEMQPKVVIPTHYKTIVGNIDDANKFKELLKENIECKILLK